MKLLIVTATSLVLSCSGCSEEPAAAPSGPAAGTVTHEYPAGTFRGDIERHIASGRYADAVKVVKDVDVDALVAADQAGYMAIGLDMILLPGAYPDVDYEPGRDWFIPGTSDAIEDHAWQFAATTFAEKYNMKRLAASGAEPPVEPDDDH